MITYPSIRLPLPHGSAWRCSERLSIGTRQVHGRSCGDAHLRHSGEQRTFRLQRPNLPRFYREFTVQPPESERLYDHAAPHASSLIESLRAFGYTLETAIADLIDNSISAGARSVQVRFYWDGMNSWIALQDDGRGMSEAELVEAMRPGSRNPLDIRDPRDLGRFGLGLKTASFSQCRCLTVASRDAEGGRAIRCWDLDYVQETGEWRLLRSAPFGSELALAEHDPKPTGTLVLWQHLDRLVTAAPVSDSRAQSRFLALVDATVRHLAMTFHRYLEGPGALRLEVNGRPVEPWEPFLTRHPLTQPLPEETLHLQGYEFRVAPFVLPHHSRLDAATLRYAGGSAGWTAQQGFYVYRNRRLLVSGDWLGLGFGREEHHRLARIRVDLPNSSDDAWQIDVRKATARPPARLRDDLRRIARLTRERAADVFRHRGKVLARAASAGYSFVWQRRVRHGKTFYAVDREHPVVAAALAGPDAARVGALLRLLEETVPVPLVALDAAERPEEQGAPFEGSPPAEVEAVARSVYDALRTSGHTAEQAVGRLLTMEPFNRFPELAAVLADSRPVED